MKLGKKLLSVFLGIAMLISMLGTTALAAGGSTNAEFTADKTTAPPPGDTTTLTSVTSANFTLDTTTYAVGKKIVDLKVSGTNDGLEAIGDTRGYGPGYMICTDASVLTGSVDSFVDSESPATFAAGTDYYLAVLLAPDTGYSISDLTAANVKLGTQSADKIVKLTYSGVTVAVFKLAQLTGGSTSTPVTAANFTLDTTTYAVGKKIVDLKVSGTNTGLLTINNTDYGYTYVICTNSSALTGNFDSMVSDSSATFAAGTDYYLAVLLDPVDGYSISDLTAANVKLGTQSADKIVELTYSGVTVAVFKLAQLTGGSTSSHVTSANFTMDTTTYAVGKKIVDLKVSGTNTGLLTIGGTDTGYAQAYVICTSSSALTGDTTSMVSAGSPAAFAAGTDYYLNIVLDPKAGYDLTGLTAANVKLDGKSADAITDLTTGATVAVFKLAQLTGGSTSSHVTVANFTLDTSTYAVGKKIVDLKVSGTNTGLEAIGGTVGYANGYAICTNASVLTGSLDSAVMAGSSTFAAGTDYYLIVVLDPATGYSISGLTAANVKLDGKSADAITDLTTGATVAVFKLAQLTGGSTSSHVTVANFTLDTSTYAVGKKIVDLKVSGTNTGLMTIGDTYTDYYYGYVIALDAGLGDLFYKDSDETFTADTTYYLGVALNPVTGYDLTGLTKENVKLNGTAATKLDLLASDYAIAVFKLDRLSSGSTPGHSGGSSSSGKTTYPITVKDAKHGDVAADRKSASSGTTVTITVDPDKGYTLETLTVLDKNGKEIKLTEKKGKYTFKMPDSKVTVTATFMDDNTMLNFFVDVSADAYYYDAVLWAAENGITGGVDETHFAPDNACTRAQIVTFLWRAAGSPAPKTMSTFSDVPADAYYAEAVAWAVENGITGGMGDGRFAPNATCTRAQAVTFLYRYAGSPAVSTMADFADVAADAYYANAVAWAAENGITGGIGNGLFGSNNNCTRAQIVTFLYRSMK